MGNTLGCKRKIKTEAECLELYNKGISLLKSNLNKVCQNVNMDELVQAYLSMCIEMSDNDYKFVIDSYYILGTLYNKDYDYKNNELNHKIESERFTKYFSYIIEYKEYLDKIITFFIDGKYGFVLEDNNCYNNKKYVDYIQKYVDIIVQDNSTNFDLILRYVNYLNTYDKKFMNKNTVENIIKKLEYLINNEYEKEYCSYLILEYFYYFSYQVSISIDSTKIISAFEYCYIYNKNIVNFYEYIKTLPEFYKFIINDTYIDIIKKQLKEHEINNKEFLKELFGVYYKHFTL